MIWNSIIPEDLDCLKLVSLVPPLQPQMGKTQAQMMQQSQQQHSPISSGVTMQQQQQQMLMPPTHSLAHSHGGQQQHQMSKDFLPSLQHSQVLGNGFAVVFVVAVVVFVVVCSCK